MENSVGNISVSVFSKDCVIAPQNPELNMWTSPSYKPTTGCPVVDVNRVELEKPEDITEFSSTTDCADNVANARKSSFFILTSLTLF